MSVLGMYMYHTVRIKEYLFCKRRVVQSVHNVWEYCIKTELEMSNCDCLYHKKPELLSQKWQVESENQANSGEMNPADIDY